MLFPDTAIFSKLDQRFSEVEIIKATKLTDELDFEDIMNQDPDALAIYSVSRAGQLTVFATDTGPTPASGQTVIALVAALNTKPVDAEFEKISEYAPAASDRDVTGFAMGHSNCIRNAKTFVTLATQAGY